MIRVFRNIRRSAVDLFREELELILAAAAAVLILGFLGITICPDYDWCLDALIEWDKLPGHQ